jgi:hypothetical protein
MATNRVTIPKSYKGLKAVYITPSEEGLLRRTSHPKGSSQPAKGPGGLLMMDGEEDRDRTFAKKHGLTLAAVEAAGGSTMRRSTLTAMKAAATPATTAAAAPAAASTASTASTAAATTPAATATAASGDATPATFRRTRGGYDPDTSVDFTNTNPSYWASAVSYFRAHPDGNPVTGELGIWIPNLEKEGAERTALAAIAGGVTAHVDSNYANRTVTDEGRRTATESYRGGAEKAIRLAGTHRGGVLTDTDYAMGSTAPSEHGVYIKGGVVVKGAGTDYVKGGGDFGGLLSRGDAITGDWLDSVLGARDSDGLRIRGTYPAVAGATGSGIAAGGTATGMGTFYGGGTDPLASMPKVSDYTPYMDPNSIFGGLSKNAAVRSGLLYNPEKSNYGEEMAAAGMPAFSPGLLGVGGGVASPTYGSPASGFMKPATSGTSTVSGTGIPVGSTTTAPGRTYAFPTGRPLYGGAMSKDIPTFTSLDYLSSAFPTTGDYGVAYPAAKGAAKIGGDLYSLGLGGGWSKTGFSYPLVTGST